jgi:hypothetical protein
MAATQKTTVIFPKNILKALRIFMATNNMSQHEQSKVVAEALKEYLTLRGVQIDKDGTSYVKVDYEILDESD